MFTLNINTLKLGVFFYFIAYGYYGSVVPKNNELDVVSILLTILFALITQRENLSGKTISRDLGLH